MGPPLASPRTKSSSPPKRFRRPLAPPHAPQVLFLKKRIHELPLRKYRPGGDPTKLLTNLVKFGAHAPARDDSADIFDISLTAMSILTTIRLSC